MSKLLRRNSRKFSAATLIAGALVLLMFVFVDRSQSANPTNGTIGPMGPNVVWDGTAAGGTSQLSEDSCVEGFSCDTFTLTISGDPSDWTGKQVHLQFDWLDAANDYDIYVHKGDNTGPIVGSSVNTHLSGHTESIDLDPNVPSIGTGVFSVHIVYFIVAPQTGIGPPPANDQYHAVASVTAAVAPTPTPTPGASPTPTAPPVIPPGTPRLHNHYAPTGVADDAGEPTIGSNWQSEQSFSNNNIATGAANPAIPNGGTTNYFGGFLSYMLRVRFNDCASPAIAPFEKMPIFLAATTRVFGDPILFTDHLTGRTFVAQLEGLTPVGSTIDFTDDDGDTFQPSQGAGPSCVDHQTIGGGAFHEPLPPGLVYPHAVYYASQCISNATSELSVDGGVTFPIESNMFTASDCAGLHGHIKIAPDGTAYVPDKACATAGVPLLLGGEAAVVVSENNGLTWSVRTVPGATSTASVDDASVGVSWCPPEEAATCDKAARSNTIYLGFMFADGRAGIAKSNDKGVTWTPPVDVGAQVGVKHIAFPAVAVGDPDRAAFAFFGTTTSGNYSAPEFPGVWHLYLATTFDGGATWTTQNLTPDDPIQRGGICTGGVCRNLLDFFDMAIDKRGRLLIAGEDGCIGSCVNGGPNSFTAKAFISRQAGGKRMFSVFDPVEPALPGAPRVTGGFDVLPPTKAILSWPVPDHGGSPITAYKVYHATAAGGPFTLLATVPVNNYTDATLQADNYYRVTAVNGVGEGPYCGEFRPVGVPPNTCALPGLLVQDDFNRDGTDKDSGVNTPPDPRVNLRQLYVGEPFFGAGVNKLVFTMQVAPSPGATTAPPNSQWFIIWNRITGPTADGSDRNYVAMRSDAFGEVSFEYGTFGPPLDPTAPVPNANTPLKVGDADEGTFNAETGVITITVSNDKVENIGVGFDLAGMACRTYFNRPDPGQRSTNNASDVMEETLYSLRGNAFCGIIEIGKLLNISTREQVGTGDNVLIGGFIITGSAPKKVIMRGIGPSLQKDGGPFAGRMEDPTLELHDATGVLATNNDWKENQAEVEATGIPPTHDKESAIVRTLAPGAYTVILRGFQNTTGIALVEAYDLEAVGASEMANISTRGLVGTGDNVLIGGFFTGPNTAAHTKVVVRAIGPSIKTQLPNALDDPTLELRDQFGALIGANDNWKDGQQAEIQAAGLAPTSDAESALIKTLVPGPYTALVRGANNTTGVGLVEVYHVP